MLWRMADGQITLRLFRLCAQNVSCAAVSSEQISPGVCPNKVPQRLDPLGHADQIVVHAGPGFEHRSDPIVSQALVLERDLHAVSDK